MRVLTVMATAPDPRGEHDGVFAAQNLDLDRIRPRDTCHFLRSIALRCQVELEFMGVPIPTITWHISMWEGE